MNLSLKYRLHCTWSKMDVLQRSHNVIRGKVGVFVTARYKKGATVKYRNPFLFSLLSSKNVFRDLVLPCDDFDPTISWFSNLIRCLYQ